MPSPIEQALQSLLPTTNILPSQLISIAGALLAQSKNAAPTLKTEEEIARTYACCHIACERLLNKLALDIGKINPPCGPRVYKKLHSYLDGVLTAGTTSQPVTPRTKSTIDVVKTDTPRRAKVTETRELKNSATPSKTSTESSKRKRQHVPVTENAVVPEHMAQLSQHLCRSVRLPEVIPHMYAGLESAWPSLNIEHAPDDSAETPSKRQRKLSAKAEALHVKSTKLTVETGKVPLLVVAMLHNTISRLRDTEVTTDEAEDIFGEMLSFLRDKDEDLAEAVYDENYADIASSIATLGNSLQSLPFWQSWFENIPCLSNITTDDRADRDEERDALLPRPKPSKTPLRRKEKHAQADHDLPGASGLLPGLGTMFQPTVDWLSDERRAEYAIWEKGIFREIDAIEQKA